MMTEVAKAAKGRAAALLASPAARDRDDFAPRAAACYALYHLPDVIVSFEALWPGFMHDFNPSTPDADFVLAAELLELEAERRRGKAAAE